MCLQLRVLLVLLAPELLKQVAVVCVCTCAVVTLHYVGTADMFLLTFVLLLWNILPTGASPVTGSSCLGLMYCIKVFLAFPL